jgi:hypothetical protein
MKKLRPRPGWRKINWGLTPELCWSFDPVPLNLDDLAAAGRSPESLAIAGGSNVCSMISVDVARDPVFLRKSSDLFYSQRTRASENQDDNAAGKSLLSAGIKADILNSLFMPAASTVLALKI